MSRAITANRVRCCGHESRSKGDTLGERQKMPSPPASSHLTQLYRLYHRPDRGILVKLSSLPSPRVRVGRNLPGLDW